MREYLVEGKNIPDKGKELVQKAMSQGHCWQSSWYSRETVCLERSTRDSATEDEITEVTGESDNGGH